MTGRHPIEHGRASPTTSAGWISYWMDYYRRSKQLKRAGPKSWNANKETWTRKLVQAKRIRCRECTRIAKLWLKTFAYGPEKNLLRENVLAGRKTKRREL